MTTAHLSSLTFVVLALASGATLAQQRPAAVPAAAAASAAKDCPNPKRHDHAADKSMPTSAPCPAAAASGAKAKPQHEHQKFHKG